LRPPIAEDRLLVSVPLISIIDDDLSVRDGLSDFIQSLGYSVRAFDSAEAFLKSSQLRGTWCVIADVCLAAMNGVQLQHHLRSQGYRVPFIFITAIPDENMRRLAFDGGAVCFLIKPLDGDVLVDCLTSALDAPSPRVS
jgi:FixJ family two-component response regulator